MVAIGTLFTGLFHLIVPEQKFGFTNSNYGDIEEEDSTEQKAKWEAQLKKAQSAKRLAEYYEKTRELARRPPAAGRPRSPAEPDRAAGRVRADQALRLSAGRIRQLREHVGVITKHPLDTFNIM